MGTPRAASPRLATATTAQTAAAAVLEDHGLVLRHEAGCGLAPPFESFPDYSKLNAGKHNASRKDTFDTPARLPGGKKRGGNAQGPDSPRVRELLHVSELAVAKNLRDLQGTMLAELKREIHEALKPLRQEIAGTTADARLVSAIKEIMERLRALDHPPVDLAPLLSEIARLAGAQTDAVGICEGLRQEVDALKSMAEAARESREMVGMERDRRIGELERSLGGVQTTLEKILLGQEDLHRSSLQTAKELHTIQTVTTNHAENFLAGVERQFERFICERPVNVDFQQPLIKIGALHKSMSGEVRMVLQEISKVQKALNVDFVNVLDTRLARVYDGMHTEMESVATELNKARGDFAMNRDRSWGLTRYRDIWAQTDNAGQVDAFSQTERAWGQVEGRQAKKRVPRVAKVNQKVPVKGPVFADAEQMRQKARQALITPQYNVFDYYHTNGCAQAIAKHPAFELVTLMVIVANAIWIGVDTDLNKAPILNDAELHFQVVEHLFCGYFTMELLTRFAAFSRKRHCLMDVWFVFDSLLVLLMVAETWVISLAIFIGGPAVGTELNKGSILRIVRVVKMLRVGRLTRLLRSVPELLIIIKGVKAASRSVIVFFAMWLIIIYVFALLFTQIADGDQTRYFATVPSAMNSLLLDGILPSHAGIVNGAAEENWVFWPLTMVFICLAVLTLMNMLVGVLVEVVGAIAITEKESLVVLNLAASLREAMTQHEMDPEEPMTQKQFQDLLVEPEIAHIISSVGADVVMLAEMSEAIYEDIHRERGETTMKFEAFVDLILNLRGNNPAKVKDVKEQLRHIKLMFGESTNGLMQRIADELKAIREALRQDDGDGQESSALPGTFRRLSSNVSALSGAEVGNVSMQTMDIGTPTQG